MKLVTLLLSFLIMLGCSGYQSKEQTVVGIEGLYLLDANHVSSTKSLQSKPQVLCDALTKDANQEPTRIKGFVISNEREIAPLYFDPEDIKENDRRTYMGRVEMDGSITAYENDSELLIKMERTFGGKLILTHGYLTEKTTLDAISLPKVQEIRKIILACKSQQ